MGCCAQGVGGRIDLRSERRPIPMGRAAPVTRHSILCVAHSCCRASSSGGARGGGVGFAISAELQCATAQVSPGGPSDGLDKAFPAAIQFHPIGARRCGHCPKLAIESTTGTTLPV